MLDMHGNLEPEENIWNDRNDVNDLYQDMERLNALYEELMWPHDVELEWDHRDLLEFSIEGNHITIRNRSREGR